MHAVPAAPVATIHYEQPAMNPESKMLTCFGTLMLLSPCLASCAAVGPSRTQDLAGMWRFQIDHDRIGIVEALSTVPALVFAAQIPDRATLVSAQLAHRNRDKIFENALKAANAMTAVFQH